MNELFGDPITILDGVYLLKGFADSEAMQPLLSTIVEAAPLRQMETGRGFKMSVSQTNCGEAGWVSDRRGYRYETIDPLTNNPWPRMPEAFRALSSQAAQRVGYSAFQADACLINRFFVIGPQRSGKSTPIDLEDGDVVVFGGPARRYFHGVRKLKVTTDPRYGTYRWNLTFRRALS